MGATEEWGLARRAGVMLVLLITRITDVLSLLLIAALPLFALGLVAQSFTAYLLLIFAIIGWAADHGSAIARRIFDEGYTSVTEDEPDSTFGLRAAAVLVLYTDLTLAIATGVGLLLFPYSPTAAIIATPLICVANRALIERAWYLSPAALVIEGAARIAGHREYLLSQLTSPLVRDIDLRALFARPRE